jgi:ligand-binding sensor domain-containing protein
VRQKIQRFRFPFFLFAFFFYIFASTEAGFLIRPLSFQHITPKEGLSGEMVLAIAVQGDQVWFGTYAGGATLYDRSTKVFKAYTTKGEPTVMVDDGVSINWKNLPPYNHVSAICPDGDQIWFGTYFYGYGGGGISCYRPKNKIPWKTFNTYDRRAKKVVSMAVDGKWLWVGSERGLSLLNKKTGQWSDFYSIQNGLAGNFVNMILIQPDYLWVGTNAGVSRLDKAKRSWKTYAQDKGIVDLEIKSLAKVGEKIWAGTSPGTLFEYNRTKDCWEKIETADPLKKGGINSITVINDKVFICRDNGVSVLNMASGQWDSLTSSDGLLSDTVFCAAEDKDGVWFGTDQGASLLIMAK